MNKGRLKVSQSAKGKSRNSVVKITNIKLEKNILQEIIIRIIEHFTPEKIILFGSYGYGKPTIDSDIDLLIIKEDIKSKRSESVKIRRILRGFKMPFDIIVTTPREFEFYSKEWVNSVFAEAKKKGVVIYERI
ncbi:MAG: nucleotidyltransferase domain-containing protein [bacterium]